MEHHCIGIKNENRTGVLHTVSPFIKAIWVFVFQPFFVPPWRYFPPSITSHYTWEYWITLLLVLTDKGGAFMASLSIKIPSVPLITTATCTLVSDGLLGSRESPPLLPPLLSLPLRQYSWHPDIKSTDVILSLISASIKYPKPSAWNSRYYPSIFFLQGGKLTSLDYLEPSKVR